jgi:hypothetical protein
MKSTRRNFLLTAAGGTLGGLAAAQAVKQPDAIGARLLDDRHPPASLQAFLRQIEARYGDRVFAYSAAGAHGQMEAQGQHAKA